MISASLKGNDFLQMLCIYSFLSGYTKHKNYSDCKLKKKIYRIFL